MVKVSNGLIFQDMFHSPAKYLPATGFGLKLHEGVSWKAVEEWPGMDSC